MRPVIALLAIPPCCIGLLVGCSRSNDAELSKAKTETEAVKVELAQARAAAEPLKRELAQMKAEAETARAELAKVRAELAAARRELNAAKQTRDKETIAGKKTAGQKISDLLAVDQKGTSDDMEIEVIEVRKKARKFRPLEITVRITNRSKTVVKRAYFYFSVKDVFGNVYGIWPGSVQQLYPGKSGLQRHSFDMAVENAEYVILGVSNMDGSHFDVIRFKIPRSMWTGAGK